MRKKAFTLMELLVVIGIIVLLIAILLPALGKAKTLAYNSSTESLMTHLSTSIETYYTTFHAYPGPAGPNVTSTPGGTKISGAQNLLLGMTYMMSNAAKPANGVSLPFAAGWWADPTQPNGPANYATIRQDGTPEQLSPFLDPTSKQLSTPTTPGGTTWPVTGGVAGAASLGNNFAFPVIVDAFPDGMPILYYRRTPGVDAFGANGAAPYASAQPVAYYWNDNAEYTSSTNLIATSGAVVNHPLPGKTGALSNAAQGLSELEYIAENGSGATATARGGFILIAAGMDRVYGRVYTAGTPGPPDDNVRVGGN